MSSTFGNILKITLFGESHAKAIGLTIDGLPAGIEIDKEGIEKDLVKRNPKNAFTTTRHEPDEVNFLCGVLDGKTTGAPVTFIIENKDVDDSDYTKGVIRPGHSDYTNYLKYGGFNDYRGGGFSSGRNTAPLVVMGSICKQLLAKRNIKMGSHLHCIYDVADAEFDEDPKELEVQIDKLNKDLFPVISETKQEQMKAAIERAKRNKDSVGGTLETAIINVPAGLGEPYFDSFESIVAHLLFSVPGVKAIQFGDGWKFARRLGSEVKDEIKYDKDGNVIFLANHNGGINGGITNGNTILLQTIIKAPSSIGQSQRSINIETKENIDLSIKGRHDPCILPRARVVIESLLAFALVDMLMLKESKKF